MGQPTRPTQPSIPPGSVNKKKFMHFYITGVTGLLYRGDTIKAAYQGYMQAKVYERGLGLWPRLSDGPVCGA